jgi:prophage antirepressor-like protein
MEQNNESQSTGLVEVFNFNQNSTPIRVQVINDEPWFVAKDVCEVLGISNNRDAVSRLEDDEKAMSVLPTQFGDKEMWLVNESGLYALIFQSRKPEAKTFRKWVTSEVLPSIRKKGYYGARKQNNDYLDARDIPYETRKFNDSPVRCITIEGETWYSLNDIHAAVGSRTESTQAAKKLNAKQTLAKKIWLFGVTNPGWFVTMQGAMLLLCASRKMAQARQLELSFN